MKQNKLTEEEFAFVIELYAKAKAKLDQHLKETKQKLSKKEYDKLLDKFFNEELVNAINSAEEMNDEEKNDKEESFDEMDDLDLDEMNDVWDEMDEEE